MRLNIAGIQESSHSCPASSTDAAATAAEAPLVGAAASSSAGFTVVPPTSMLPVFPIRRSQPESIRLHKQMQADKGIEPRAHLTLEQQVGLRTVGAYASNTQNVAPDSRSPASQEFWQAHQQQFIGEGLPGDVLGQAIQALVHSAMSVFRTRTWAH